MCLWPRVMFVHIGFSKLLIRLILCPEKEKREEQNGGGKKEKSENWKRGRDIKVKI